jgi:hypothetical protein
MFRISRDTNTVIDVAQADEIEPAVRTSEPGRYDVDQIERDPLPSGNTSRRWGVAIKRQDGSVLVGADPWEAVRG